MQTPKVLRKQTNKTEHQAQINPEIRRTHDNKLERRGVEKRYSGYYYC